MIYNRVPLLQVLDAGRVNYNFFYALHLFVPHYTPLCL